MTKKRKSTKLIKALIWSGATLVVLSYLTLLILPKQTFFFNFFCGHNGCGYAGLGIVGYAIYTALIPFTIGTILVTTGIVLRFR